MPRIVSSAGKIRGDSDCRRFRGGFLRRRELSGGVVVRGGAGKRIGGL